MTSVKLELDLTEQCHCIDSEGDAYSYCSYCEGKGEVLTENGKTMLKFLRKFMFTDLN